MRIQQIVPVLVKTYLNPQTRKRAIYLKGKSGIGKSDVIFQASELLGQHIDDWQGVVDLRLSQMEPTDLRGVPTIVDGRTVWARPDFLPSSGAGILFLDEISSAPPSIQAAAYQLILTPQDFGVPAEWLVVCAGNSKSDRGVTFNIAAPLINRMTELSVETTLDDFLEYAVTKNIRPEVLSFLRDRPDMLHKFEPTNETKPFPSPRAWFAVSDKLALDLPPRARVELVNGDVGEEAGVSFEAHMRVYESMPRIDDILEGKDVPVPKDMNVVYCVAMGLATRVTKQTLDIAYDFIKKLPVEVQALIIKLTHQRGELKGTKAFTDFAVNNPEVFRMQN